MIIEALFEMSFSRRDFLRTTAGLLATTVVPPRVRDPRPIRVLVVGAGAAGLTTAYELHRAGHDVEVFEARDRPGGRMHTLRKPFSDGLYAEAGALMLTSNNPGLEYAREFGLELDPIPFRPDQGSLALIRGHRIEVRPDEAVRWPVELLESEQGLSVFALQSKYHRSRIRETEGLDTIHSPGFPHDRFLPLDELSLRKFWELGGASPGAIDLMQLRYYDGYGEGIDSVSLLQLAREAASFAGVTGSFQVRGGNDKICEELASRMGGRVHYSRPVRAVRQGPSGVRIVVNLNGSSEEVDADVVVLTPPTQVLRDIEFSPTLPERKARALNELPGTDVTRTFVQTRSRFWERRGLDGSAVTDLELGAIGHNSVAQNGTRGILESFAYGSDARMMARRSPEARQTLLREVLHRVYSESVSELESGASYAWGDDPWARGGHSAFKPGQVGAFFQALREPAGRIYFAGDTMGGVPGYSHAAFESGQEVARAIGQSRWARG